MESYTASYLVWRGMVCGMNRHGMVWFVVWHSIWYYTVGMAWTCLWSRSHMEDLLKHGGPLHSGGQVHSWEDPFIVEVRFTVARTTSVVEVLSTCAGDCHTLKSHSHLGDPFTCGGPVHRCRRSHSHLEVLFI